MPALISSRLIVTPKDQRVGVWESTDCLSDRDVSSLDDASGVGVGGIESAGSGFVVTGYFGRLADLNVDEDTRRRLIPVASLGLSVRSMNCLRAGGISTAGELFEQTTEDLLSIPKMGRKPVSEIQERLSELGLSGSGPHSHWKRTLDLRLLLGLIDVEPDLAPFVSLSGYTLVWEVCAASSVTLRNRLGTKSAVEQLERALERVGVPLHTVIPKWLPPAAGRIRDAFVNELDILAGEFLTAMAPAADPVVSAIVQEASTSLADEIDRFILAGVKPEYKKALSLRKGWDGGFGETLEEVGAISSLTRERVRQIEKKLRPVQPAAGFHFLTKALEIVRQATPCVADVAEAALWVGFPGDLQIRIEGLLSAAEIVGISPGFDIERIGTERFVGSAADMEAMRQIERVARADVSHYGVGSLDRVCAEIPTIAPAAIGHHLRTSPYCLWDPIFPSGFYLPTTRNSALSRLRRILSVISPVPAEVARIQILRDQRMEGSEFSPAMLLKIAQAQTWCCVVGEEISKGDGLEADSEDSNEAKVVALLRQHGPVMDSRLLQVMAMNTGVSDAHLTILLGNSPLIVKHGRALYGLIGSAPGAEVARTAPDSTAVFEAETQPHEPLPEGEVDGLGTFEDFEAASPDFCLRAFSHMATRARQLKLLLLAFWVVRQ